jgi:hypothetical protein
LLPLRCVCAAVQIFVEIERARLTRRLAAMKESEGNIAEAADILQEVAVETFGAMAKTEKIAYILEQVCGTLSWAGLTRAHASVLPGLGCTGTKSERTALAGLFNAGRGRWYSMHLLLAECLALLLGSCGSCRGLSSDNIANLRGETSRCGCFFGAVVFRCGCAWQRKTTSGRRSWRAR